MTVAALLGSLAATCATNAAPSCPGAYGTPTVRRTGLVMRPASKSAVGLLGAAAGVEGHVHADEAGRRNRQKGHPARICAPLANNSTAGCSNLPNVQHHGRPIQQLASCLHIDRRARPCPASACRTVPPPQRWRWPRQRLPPLRYQRPQASAVLKGTTKAFFVDQTLQSGEEGARPTKGNQQMHLAACAGSGRHGAAATARPRISGV